MLKGSISDLQDTTSVISNVTLDGSCPKVQKGRVKLPDSESPRRTSKKHIIHVGPRGQTIVVQKFAKTHQDVSLRTRDALAS